MSGWRAAPTRSKRVNKNSNSEEFIEAIKKAKKAGIKSSVTIILGLGQRAKEQASCAGDRKGYKCRQA